MNIKKKLLAITLVCAIASSFAACSDKTNQNGSGSQGKVKADVQATLSSEEIQSLEKQDLTITPFNESSDNQEDPVENSNSNDSSENNVNNNSQAGNNSNNDGNNNSNSNNNNNNNDSSDENVPPSVGDLGERIYAAAYAKLGKLYWWGKSGPDYFDCSGLVYWSLKQAGVSGGRGTAASYSQKWSAVSFNNSKTGDLVCFGSPAYHIGIVIVNSDGSRSMIHAGGGDSSTHGDDPNAKVKISSIEPGSYYYSRISTIRRVS